MSRDYRTVTYQDELLADRSVRRIYADGRVEWRRRRDDGLIDWQDNHGNSGVDELLGNGLVKRSYNSGRVVYGREQGYGRTAWSGDDASNERVLTVNQSSFGGQVGAILAGVGAGMLMGSIIDPPDTLSAAEEEQLREAARASSSGGDGGGGDGGWDDSGWGGGDGDGDGDFG